MDKETGKLIGLQFALRILAKLSLEYVAERIPMPHFAVDLHGYSEAKICLAVYKEIKPREFSWDQHQYMMYLGEEVCPKILGASLDGYFMEYLLSAELTADSLLVQEDILSRLVWNRSLTWPGLHEIAWRASMEKHINVCVPDWALENECAIHGDPTLDNVLMTKEGFIRITDPIPPRWLKKPSIKAVDHGKILQSFLGWEVVLRGAPLIEYEYPKFMGNLETARRAMFWAMVAVKRIAYRDITHSVTQWATKVGKELEVLCASSF